MQVRHLCLCLLLAACADWPDVESPVTTRATGEWPRLLPLSEIVRNGTVETAKDDEAARLAARAADLRRRAGILRAEAGDIEAMEALRARLAR